MLNFNSKPPFNILFSGLLLTLSFHASALEFERCAEVFLGGNSVDTYIKKEEALPENQRDEKYLARLKKIQSSKDCHELLKFASLKDNGLLIDRSLLASDLLETFNQFHYQWIMPKDLDRSKTCVDKYQWDIFDPQAPAYHLTRTLFQKSRKASQSITAYGEPRIVRKGEDPTNSTRTGLEGKTYKDNLKIEREITFMGSGEVLGFLFERSTNSPVFEIPSTNQAQWKKKMPFQNEHNIYQHFGGGILGSPSYLYYHFKEKAFYEADGTRKLPRKLVDSIFQNLLCSSPSEFTTQQQLKNFTDDFLQINKEEKALPWNHPITKEASCLGCHLPMDSMASGFRNLTLIPSSKVCSEDNIQILYPVFLKSDHSGEMWQVGPKDTNENYDFSSSYGAGYFKGKRFRSLTQLGNLIAEDINFYSCQVKKYYQWIHKQYPSDEVVNKLSKSYLEHQDGFTLIKEIVEQ